MTVVMAIPAMPVVRMPHCNHYLGIRCRYQRNEEHQCEKTECKLLYAHGKRPLSFFNSMGSA